MKGREREKRWRRRRRAGRGDGYTDHCKHGDVFPCGMHELHSCKDKMVYI